MLRLLHYISVNRVSILSFLIVGACTAGINIFVFGLIWQFTHWHYEVAVTIAFSVALIFHFTANRYFTFKRCDVHFYQQLPKYLSMVLVNYSITLGVMYIIVSIVHLSPYIGNVTAIITTVGTGYYMSRYWVFTQIK